MVQLLSVHRPVQYGNPVDVLACVDGNETDRVARDTGQYHAGNSDRQTDRRSGRRVALTTPPGQSTSLR